MSNAIYVGHPVMFRGHPTTFLLLCAGIVLGLWVAIAGRVDADITADMQRVWGIVGLAVAVFCALALVWWWIQTRALRLKIEGEHIHLERGLLNKQHVDLDIGQVRAVKVHQTLLNRMFGVGRIEAFTTGDQPEFVAASMPRPHVVRDYVRDFRGRQERG